MTVTENIEVPDKIVASGGFADVRRGTYMGRFVAVKTVKIPEEGDFLRIRKVSINGDFFVIRNVVSTVLLQQFCKEVILWNMISHPNVLKLAGVRGDMEKGQFITVSEWMEHGNIMQFTRKNHVNRLELVRGFPFPPLLPFTKARQQLHGAVQGLKYLHGANLTHGDLKGVGSSSLCDRFLSLTLNRRISSYQMTPLLVPASRTSVL